MSTFFVIVNKTTKLPEQYPLTSGLTTEVSILQWIDDMVNNGGMGTTQELVASYEPYTRPVVDERYINVSQNQGYFNESHPVYTTLKQWKISYVQTDVALADKLVAVDTQESSANETVIPSGMQLKINTLAILGVLEFLNIDSNTTINATSISTKGKKNLRVFVKAAKKVKQNDDTKVAKKALLTANPLSNPDLSTDWSLNDFTETA
jgi:hypothetical protein